ncbi:MAG: hypothetical protein LWX51_13925 [Deltaproteobacteria bacterium]|jgi:hypothetical protein|nr:hypothetical protein [Deltaproteobacteria bacterium]
MQEYIEYFEAYNLSLTPKLGKRGRFANVSSNALAFMRISLPILIVLFTLVTSVEAAVSPSQVLVLYNADWTEDALLTDPGQDSLEIAEHYVRMHTDPETGEKPYILGLRCVHREKHLNKAHLEEKSHDNASGVALMTGQRKFSSTDKMHDSRLVEFLLPKNDAKWLFETLKLQIGHKRGTQLTVVEEGKSLFPSGAAVQEEGQWNVRLNGTFFSSGSFAVTAFCKDANEKTHRWEADYRDIQDYVFSRTGPDKIRDDKNYLQDVEKPIKAFLENPANARPDGILLKDHILFIVVCYGLPKTTVATYGIARGITDLLPNFGAIIDFGQRLQLMYYDVEAVAGIAPRPHKFIHDKHEGNEAFSVYYIRAPQAWPLFGDNANPFFHPLVYQKKKDDLKQLADPVAFTSRNRKKFSERHLYFVMRIDGATPMQARGLIDRSVYASQYGGPEMGMLPDIKLTQNKERVGDIDKSSAGRLFWDCGYRHLYYKHKGSHRLQLFRLTPQPGFFNETPVYLPGGISAIVESHNGWNRMQSTFFSQGVTMTAGVARVYKGNGIQLRHFKYKIIYILYTPSLHYTICSL